jgi:succinoglycan biosynthesis transport protein ExoP
MENKPQSMPKAINRSGGVLGDGAFTEIHSFEDRTGSYSFQSVDQSERREGLLQSWHTLLRHKVAIITTSIVGMVLGFLIGIPLKSVYRATTTLEVLATNTDFMNMKLTQAAVPGADSDNLSEEETQATLLQSGQLLNRVASVLNPIPTPKPPVSKSAWQKIPFVGRGPQPSTRERLVASAIASLKVTNPPRTRLLDISVDSTDPQMALDFTNSLVQEFIKQNVDARWASTQQTGDWLSREIDDARARLQNSENALQEYASRSSLFFTDDQKQSNVATEKLQQVQQQLSAATADRIAKQTVFELARKSPPDTLAEILSDPSLQSLSARLDEATRQVASLSAVYNSGYTKLQQAQAEVVSLQKAFTQRRTDLLKRIQTDYQGADRREKLIATAYDTQAREVAKQNEKAVQYNILKREVDSNQQLYDTMLQQMKQASIATALRASNVHIVYPAYLMENPVFPNFKLNTALGLILGLLCSAGFFFIREQTDRTLRQPGEVKLWASLPELGTIPHLPGTLNGNAGTLLQRALGGLPSSREKNPLKTAAPFAILNPADIGSWPLAVPEAFNSTLTSILRAGDKISNGRVLVFTSAGPSDGKTSVVSNIAIAAAAAGKTVLLVDADLRRPRIHEIFDLKNDFGMVDLLQPESDFARWPDIIQHTTIPRLSVISAGRAGRGASALFYSPVLSTLLNLWKFQYDLVLLDTPPALPITDARVIGILADGVVLVARAGHTTRDALLAIQERFAEDRIHLVGCILNDWVSNDPGQTYPYYAEEKQLA